MNLPRSSSGRDWREWDDPVQRSISRLCMKSYRTWRIASYLSMHPTSASRPRNCANVCGQATRFAIWCRNLWNVILLNMGCIEMKQQLRKLSVDRYPRDEKVMKATAPFPLRLHRDFCGLAAKAMGERGAVSIRTALHILLFSFLLLTIITFAMSSQYAGAQAQRTPIPLVTLVPPTLLPPAPTATATSPLTQSALARIKSNNPLVVGFLYNVNRFALPTGTGSPDNPDIDGFEPDLAQAIADDWGVKLQPEQASHVVVWVSWELGGPGNGAWADVKPSGCFI